MNDRCERCCAMLGEFEQKAKDEAKADEWWCHECHEFSEGDWIDINDRLPKIGKRVLVLLEDGSVTIGIRSSPEYTHWMPLPEPFDIKK